MQVPSIRRLLGVSCDVCMMDKIWWMMDGWVLCVVRCLGMVPRAASRVREVRQRNGLCVCKSAYPVTIYMGRSEIRDP